MTNTENFAAIDARVIALDRTQDYHIEAKHKSAIARIMDVFFYDKNEHTHCCEFTPSYYMIYLYTVVVLTPAGEQLDQFQQDEIFQAYEHCPTENCYVHCHDIDAIEKSARSSKFCYAHGDPEFNNEDDFDTEEAYHDAVMEALREHFQANCPI